MNWVEELSVFMTTESIAEAMAFAHFWWDTEMSRSSGIVERGGGGEVRKGRAQESRGKQREGEMGRELAIVAS